MASTAWKSVLGRNLVVLSFVSLLNDFSTDMVFPLLPLFVYALGGTAITIGLMEGLADSIAAFLRYFSGRISDRIGRRKIPTLIGYTLSSIAKVFYAGATHSLHVVAIRGADRIGKGFREAPRDAIIAESVPRAHWGFGFGFHRMMDTSGAMLGPFAAIIAITYLGTTSDALRTIFLIAAVPGLGALFLLLLVRETGTGQRLSEPGRFIPQAALRGPLARYLGVTMLFTLGNLSVAFLVLRAYEIGFSIVGVVLLYVVFNAVEAVASLPAGRVTDHIGRAPMLAAAYATFAILYGLVAVVNPSRWYTILPFFVLVGIAKAFREGQGRAFVADLTPVGLRATGFGAYHATIGFLALPAGLLAGRLWEVDYRWTFVAGNVFCAAALALFLWNWSRGRFRGGPGDARQDDQPAHVNEDGKLGIDS